MENFIVQKSYNACDCARVVELSTGDVITMASNIYDKLPNYQKQLFSIVKTNTQTLYPRNIKEWFKFWEWKKKRYFKKNILSYQLMFKGK